MQRWRMTMRLGILSDTHDQYAREWRAVELFREAGAEVLIHGGDLTVADMVALCAVLPLYFVRANHAADTVPALRRAAADTGAVCLSWGDLIELAGKRIGVAHGHMSTDIRRLLSARPDYLLSGHSHIASDRQDGQVRRINPGALHESDQFSVALLDLKSEVVRFLVVPG